MIVQTLFTKRMAFRLIFERGGTAATYDSVAPLTWSSGCPINQGIFHACTSCPSFFLPKEHGILNMYAVQVQLYQIPFSIESML